MTVECDRDMIGIICKFINNNVSNSILEITSIITSNGMSHDEIENEEIVEIVVKNLTEFMPRKIGEKFKKIENLVIQSSSLKFINRTDFLDNLTQLEVLSLFNNKIESIPHDAFYDLMLLRHLDIENNLIKFLEPNLLSNSIHLHVFAAGSNLIEIIHENFFENNPKLWKILLNDNNITEFRYNFKKRLDLENLKYVYVHNNPGLHCVAPVDYDENQGYPNFRIALSDLQNKIDANCEDIDDYD
ncbi:SLIT and NTRK-like protein 4 [Chironomus tepperi]|uniref:SLIT and NTRK-like protein 4 n=1 Tax=Chironomus tepperi TaxID=113505 RepID=UPI00391F0B64